MRRNDLDICADILKVAQTGAKKTRIVYQANLNFKIVKKYLDRLIDNGLLDPQGESKYYLTTPRGYDFLEQYKELILPLKNTI
jgi:predicted transcriptional regulator